MHTRRFRWFRLAALAANLLPEMARESAQVVIDQHGEPHEATAMQVVAA